MVIRGYLSGHAWREYRMVNRFMCVEMPDGMKEMTNFYTDTARTTKADVGHDEDISREEIHSLVSEEDYRFGKHMLKFSKEVQILLKWV